MDLFKNIVYPQSAEHLALLKYLLFITLFVILPYLSLLIGTSIFSLVNLTKKGDNELKSKFAKDLIDIFTPNKVMVISLGIVPFISITICIEQLLLGVASHITLSLLLSLITFTLGIFILYFYKYSFKNTPSKILGIISVILILFSTYTLIGVLQFLVDSNIWNQDRGMLFILFSAKTLLYFLFFISISFVATCTIILYKYFRTSKISQKYDSNYLSTIRKFTLRTGLIFTFLQPLLFVLSFISNPVKSLSFSYFGVGTIVLFIMLLLSIIFYVMTRAEKINLSGQAVFIIIVLFGFVIAKDILAFDTAAKVHFEKLEHKYISYKKELLKKYNSSSIVNISGESIYNNKCSACHRFDMRLVGPAYNKVLPKYEGNEKKLVDFILHPRKINPDLPIMPAQGLKPNEAEAIAKYIMSVYKK